MNDETTITTPPSAPWSELLLQVGVGFGSFILLSSILAGFVIDEAGDFGAGALFAIGLANFVCLGGTTYFLGIARGRPSATEMGLYRWQWRWAGAAAVAALVLLPLRGIVGTLVQTLIEGNMDSIAARGELFTSGVDSLGAMVLGFLGAAVLVPISEELFFRGLIHSWTMRRWSSFWARALLSSTLFGLAHFDSAGVVASSFVMGLVLAYGYEKTGSIWVPIAMHAVTNGTALLLVFISVALEMA